MQPNPGDTTNAIMVRLIKIAVIGSDAINPNDLSSSTGYISSTVCMRAFTSLSFSAFAAFGAVTGWSLASGGAS
jgi:hypothetical protein